MRTDPTPRSDRFTWKDGDITFIPLESLRTIKEAELPTDGRDQEANMLASAKTALDRFLADNPELEELSARLSTFNVFRALKIERQEIRHSNVLAWLLDPEESHGLGDTVLRRVLSNILLLTGSCPAGLSAADIELRDLSDIEVRREWRHVDLLVIDRRNRTILLLENKIYSGEPKEQLKGYLDEVEREFSDFTVIPVFLTLTGQESEDERNSKWKCYSHAQLLGVLERIFAQRKSQLSEPVSMFLSHYMETLRMLTMQDENLIDLCKTIYRRHREAIDLIIEYGKAGIAQQIVEEVLKDDGDYELLYSRPRYICFVPRSWAQVLPENRDFSIWQGYSRRIAVKCQFHILPQKIYFFFEITRMEDGNTRLTCVKELTKAGFKFNKSALTDDAVFSRFYSDNERVDDMNDEVAVRHAATHLLQNAKERFPLAEKVFRQVFGKQSR